MNKLVLFAIIIATYFFIYNLQTLQRELKNEPKVQYQTSGIGKEVF